MSGKNQETASLPAVKHMAGIILEAIFLNTILRKPKENMYTKAQIDGIIK